eukprot:CAMPEP_0119046418 /NCGR_PEP_ID=MMETSP1177-20130426/46437_1 /TAXON_ID=2985 /ORGANISM="Ochromonas sp, Strain CCMP1899" /LENGTH=502 /DNA_ID=CAMNT_0007019529 /DNA_START=123 /DNA_END=1628 /DNA_ORIENTATION=-
MFLLALFLLPVRLYSLQLMPLCSQGVYPVNSIRKNFCLSSSKFDTNIDDLYLLSRIELQTLSKAYKLKANSKTQDLIEQIKLFRENLNVNNEDSEKEILPSNEQTLKVSSLEKTAIIDGSNNAVPIRKNLKYGVKNGDIGEVLKDQGVQIDDLLALKDSLMKGGFKFNSDDEDDFDFSGDDFDGSNIEEAFYDENYIFDDRNIDSEVEIKDILLEEEEKSKANKLKSQLIKESKKLQKEQNSLNNMPSFDKKNQNDSSKKNAKPLVIDSNYVKKPIVTESGFNRIQQKQLQQKEEFIAAENIQNLMNSKDIEKSQNNNNDGIIKQSPIYEKLNKREEVFDEYDNNEDNKDNFESLEALDERMDELYGDLDTSPTKEVINSVKKVTTIVKPVQNNSIPEELEKIKEVDERMDELYGDLDTSSTKEVINSVSKLTTKIAKPVHSKSISEELEKIKEVDSGAISDDSDSDIDPIKNDLIADPIKNDLIDILDNNIMSDINNPIKW